MKMVCESSLENVEYKIYQTENWPFASKIFEPCCCIQGKENFFVGPNSS